MDRGKTVTVITAYPVYSDRCLREAFAFAKANCWERISVKDYRNGYQDARIVNYEKNRAGFFVAD